jgi:hypothetical protein
MEQVERRQDCPPSRGRGRGEDRGLSGVPLRIVAALLCHGRIVNQSNRGTRSTDSPSPAPRGRSPWSCRLHAEATAMHFVSGSASSLGPPWRRPPVPSRLADRSGRGSTCSRSEWAVSRAWPGCARRATRCVGSPQRGRTLFLDHLRMLPLSDLAASPCDRCALSSSSVSVVPAVRLDFAKLRESPKTSPSVSTPRTSSVRLRQTANG